MAISDEDLVAYVDADDGESFFDLVVETFMQSGLSWDHIPDPTVDECLPKFTEIVRDTSPAQLPLDEAIESACIETASDWLFQRVNGALTDPKPNWSVWLSGSRRGAAPALVSGGNSCAKAVQMRIELRREDPLEIGVYPDGQAPWQTNSMPRSGLHRAN